MSKPSKIPSTFYKRWKGQEFYRQVTDQSKRHRDRNEPMSQALADRIRKALNK